MLGVIIRELPKGASWHVHVKEMAAVYSKGSTEYDQIKRAGHRIENIANDLGVWNDPIQPMCRVISSWEALSRAVSPAVRGHARHVINVFWLGYFLIHHQVLTDWFCNAWLRLVNHRVQMLEALIHGGLAGAKANRRLEELQRIKDQDPAEFLSDCWYYAGLFHDAAGCVQKYPTVHKVMDELLREFKGVVSPLPMPEKWLSVDLATKADGLFSEYNSEMAGVLKPAWEKSVKESRPDHGVVAALHLRDHVKDPIQQCYAYEAAGAMAVHNLIGDLDKGVTDLLSWDSEPLVCLLLLCDQIQTWDRERGDETLDGPDGPERAQLTDMSVKTVNSRPQISICIDYIAPRHLDYDPELFERVKSKLEDTLKDRPIRALRRIHKKWPFDLTVECRLSGRPLSHGMNFGK